MIKRKSSEFLEARFVPHKIERNIFMAVENDHEHELQTHNKENFNPNSHVSKHQITDQNQQSVDDMANLWNQIDDSQNQLHSQKSQSIVSDDVIELDEQEMQLCFGKTIQKEQKPSQPKIKVQENQIRQTFMSSSSSEDLGELWDQVQKENMVDDQQEKNSKIQQTQLKENKSDVIEKNDNVNQEQEAQDQTQCKEQQDQYPLSEGQKKIKAEIEEKIEDRFYYKLGQTTGLYHYQKYLTSFFKQPVYDFFFFSAAQNPNTYLLYSMNPKKPLLYCSPSNQKGLTYKFTIPETKQQIGSIVIIKTKKNDGRYYFLKIYDPFEGNYVRSDALIEVSDGFIQNFCYCNTKVYLSGNNSFENLDTKQMIDKTKYKQRFYMSLSNKKGKLTANMKLNGITSSPYNGCLQDKTGNILFLLGSINSTKNNYIIKIGHPFSILIGMATAVARLEYINSFLE